MIDPVTFREAILSVIVLGGGAFAVEQYVRDRSWPGSRSKNANGVEGNG